MEHKFALMEKQMGLMESRISKLTYVEPTEAEISDLVKLPELVRTPEVITELPLKKRVVDADDCMFSRQLKPFDTEDLIADVTLVNIPIVKQDPVDEAEVKVLIANNGRAVCSRDFCGNL